MIGECIFTLRYANRTSEEDDQFQVELTQFFRKFHQEENPIILPTPNENDSRFGDWIFQYPISRGAFGVVYMVINSRTGKPAAAKRILKSKKNALNVHREIKMAKRISEFTHVSCTRSHFQPLENSPNDGAKERISTAFEIHHLQARSKAELVI